MPSLVPSENPEDLEPQDSSPNLAQASEMSIILEYQRYAAKFPILTEQQELDLVNDYFNNKNEKAGKLLILSHLRLALKVVLQYKRYNVSLMELLTEAILGMFHALKKFDPSKGARFGTYSELWMHDKVRNFINKSYSYIQAGSFAIRNKILFQKKSPNEKFENPLANYKEISLENQYQDSEGENSALMSQISQNVITPEANSILAEEGSRNALLIQKMLNVLNERERYIIQQRYQDETKKRKTLEELSEELEISKERVRQIEAIALKKMRSIVDLG